MIATDETGRPQFYDLIRLTRTPAYVASDILWLNGTDLRSLPLSERRKRLQAILPARGPVISEALSVVGRGICSMVRGSGQHIRQAGGDTS